MSGTQSQPNDPRSGRLVTTADFDSIGLDLQAMLNTTNPNVLHINDAWAITNTDCAFACNNFVGVQRSHRDNDYNFGWVDFSRDRGTYVYTPHDPYIIQVLTNPATDIKEIATIQIPNSTPVPLTVTKTYQEEEIEATRILNCWSVSLTLSASFEMAGNKFELETSFDQSREDETSKSKSTTTSISTEVSVPPTSDYTLHVMQFTTKQTVMYGLDLVIGSDNPDGSIGKVTRDQSNWDRWFKWEDIAPDHVKQTAKYMVETTHAVTKVELRPTSPEAATPLLHGVQDPTGKQSHTRFLSQVRAPVA